MKLTNTMRETFVHAAMQDVPSINYVEQIHAVAAKAARDALPTKIRGVYEDLNCRPYIETTSIQVAGAYITIPGLHSDREVVKKACEPLEKLKETQDAAHKELRQKLHQIANACSTRKALSDALPEFEKYLPIDESAANRQMPVVTGVVSAFMRAGWPKDQKKTAAKQTSKKAA